MTSWTTTPAADALMPYAPVHARARRGAQGVEIAFTRRARIDADAWEPMEVPLGEEREAYSVEILDGAGAVRRALAATSTAILYAAAAELADFGAPQTALRLRIRQISASVGPGFALETLAPVAA